MFAEKAFELIKELSCSSNFSLAPFNEEKVRLVLEEMRLLFEENQKDVSSAIGGEQHLYPSIQIRHAALERNRRCLLAYIFNRLQRLRDMRWQFGSILPADVKSGLSEKEVQWFGEYNSMLAKYMGSIGDDGLDLTQHMQPPKSLYIEVRCLMDHGELETADGSTVLLKKDSQHFLLRTECEQLIRQGILEHVIT